MKKIRNGMFETNSSSSHSIILNKGRITDKLNPDKYGILKIYPDEFGWDIMDYTDAYTKASYCLTYAKQAKNKKWENMLRKVLLRHTQAKEVEFIQDNNMYPWGYIDHQSGPEEMGACTPVFNSESDLANFIFNPECILHTDNDNH